MDIHSKAAIQVVISQCLDYIYALTNSTELDRGPFESFQDDFTRSVLPKNIDYFYELAYLGALLRDLDRANYDIDKTDLFPFVGIEPFVNSEINCHTISYVQQELVKRRNMLGYILRIDDILLEAMES